MTHHDPRIDLTPMSSLVGAYLTTHAADMERAVKHETDVQVSAAEVDLASCLRDLGITSWRQQVPCGPYYVDFVAAGLVAVEVDGSAYHDDAEREQRRDAHLRQHFASVRHFRALDVFLNAAGVVRQVNDEVERIKAAAIIVLRDGAVDDPRYAAAERVLHAADEAERC